MSRKEKQDYLLKKGYLPYQLLQLNDNGIDWLMNVEKVIKVCDKHKNIADGDYDWN